jgi:AGZA family xanthine/uracil permease-like MFS transporter
MIGVISYAAINLLNNIFGKEKKKVSLVMYVLAAIFIIKIIFASH